MIFSCIKKRLSIKFQQINKTSYSQEKIKKNYFVAPCINNIADKFIKRFKNIPNFKIFFYGINKLNNKIIIIIIARYFTKQEGNEKKTATIEQIGCKKR